MWKQIKKLVGIILAVVPAVRGLAELRRLLVCAGITIFWKWMKDFFFPLNWFSFLKQTLLKHFMFLF